MKSRIRTRKKSPTEQTPDFSTAPAQPMFQSRPFVVQSQTAEKSQQPPDLKTSLRQAERYGHHLSRMEHTGVPPATAVQPKKGMGQPMQSNRAKAPQVLQAKLTVGEPGDRYEQEADEVAARVVDRIDASGESKPRQDQAQEQAQSQSVQQRKKKKSSQSLGLNIQPLVQRASTGESQEAKPRLEQSIEQKRDGGQPLSNNIREPMEQEFGADFSGVKVHTDTQSDQLNQSIQAKAFTTGKDIFFRQGAYEPGSRGGQKLIAHELTHVVQQNSPVVQRATVVQMAPKSKNKGKKKEENKQGKKEEQETFSLSKEAIDQIINKLKELKVGEDDAGAEIKIDSEGASQFKKTCEANQEKLTLNDLATWVKQYLKPQIVEYGEDGEEIHKEFKEAEVESWLKGDLSSIQAEDRQKVTAADNQALAEASANALKAADQYEIEDINSLKTKNHFQIADILMKAKNLPSGWEMELYETYVSTQDDNGSFGQEYRMRGGNDQWVIHVHRDRNCKLTKAHVKNRQLTTVTGQSAHLDNLGRLENIGIKRVERGWGRRISGSYNKDGRTVKVKTEEALNEYRNQGQKAK